MTFQNNLDFARSLDREDELKSFRNEFLFPQHNNEDVVYFTGNSLGLQPVHVIDYIRQELDDWAKFGVEGHFLARNPWLSYHEILTEKAAKIVGAKPVEVVMMNQLTVNLHLMMVSFYRPDNKRYRILCEAKAFPSDQYALETQVRYHGFDPDDAIVEIAPRDGEYTIHEQDIYDAIEKLGDTLALVMIGGVNYFTGQVFDMQTITAKAHAVGAYAGFDLAHAAGNIELKLHDWDVDFAAWCTYKYLNSGPGSVGGVFIHERHATEDLPRFAGWWGHDKASRFKMDKGFDPIPGAEGWQLSNAPVFSMAAHNASLDVFMKAGWEKLGKKSKLLTAYLEYIITDINTLISDTNKKLEIITPASRGCQLSVIAHGHGKELYNALLANGVICDWREPNAIRMAPVPLYNNFEDIYRFGVIIKKALSL